MTTSNALLKLENVSFHYMQRKGLRLHKCPVLIDISFNVFEGETLGVLGRNGCGKSTLLKLLAGIYRPSEGSIQSDGAKVSLQTLNAGFDMALSGRDNALISAMLLGHEKRFAMSMLESINEMAELGTKFYEPVKTYSTGMRARLGFATAVTMETDVLLIDEVLGVGDAAFRKKAENIIEKKIQEGMTVVLVSHAAHQVKKLCTRALLIDEGKLIEEGDVNHVLDKYNEVLLSTNA